MWVASYGVMPHVYIVTTGPGANGTTSPRAVSYNLTSPCLLRDAGELDRDAGLVVDVELKEDGREGLDRGRERQFAGVERAHVRDLAHQVGRGVRGRRVIRADQDVALDGVAEVAQLLGRHVVEGGGHAALWHRGLHARRHRAPRGHQRLELVADPRERVGHADDDLVAKLLLDQYRRLGGAVPRGRDDDDVGVRRALVVGRPDAKLAVGPAAEQRVDCLHRPVLRARSDHGLEADRRQAGGEGAARRPCPTQDPDTHERKPYREGALSPPTQAIRSRAPRDHEDGAEAMGLEGPERRKTGTARTRRLPRPYGRCRRTGPLSGATRSMAPDDQETSNVARFLRIGVAMGLLDGKRILVTGVLTDASLAFGVAELAQREGAEVVLTGAGRGLNLTRRVAR